MWAKVSNLNNLPNNRILSKHEIWQSILELNEIIDRYSSPQV